MGLVDAAKEGVIAGRSVSVWLLASVIPLFGDAMWAGKALGVLAGISIVVSMTRLLGPWAGLWILGSPALINASIHGDPDVWVVGALFSGVVLWRTGFRSLAAVAGAVTVALLFDVPVPTDREWDALIAFGTESAVDPARVLGAIALAWGLFRGNPASRFLLGSLAAAVAGIHGLQGAPWTVLWAEVSLLAGVAAVETGPALMVVSLLTIGLRLPSVWSGPEDGEDRRAAIRSASDVPGVFYCSNPLFVTVGDGGLFRPCVNLDSLGLPSEEIRPTDLVRGDWVVLDQASVHGRYTGLIPMFEGSGAATDHGSWKRFSLAVRGGARPAP